MSDEKLSLKHKKEARAAHDALPPRSHSRIYCNPMLQSWSYTQPAFNRAVERTPISMSGILQSSSSPWKGNSATKLLSPIFTRYLSGTLVGNSPIPCHSSIARMRFSMSISIFRLSSTTSLLAASCCFLFIAFIRSIKILLMLSSSLPFRRRV